MGWQIVPYCGNPQPYNGYPGVTVHGGVGATAAFGDPSRLASDRMRRGPAWGWAFRDLKKPRTQYQRPTVSRQARSAASSAPSDSRRERSEKCRRPA